MICPTVIVTKPLRRILQPWPGAAASPWCPPDLAICAISALKTYPTSAAAVTAPGQKSWWPPQASRGQQAREGNHAELTAEAQAKQPGVKQPSVNFSSRRCIDIELGILLP